MRRDRLIRRHQTHPPLRNPRGEQRRDHVTRARLTVDQNHRRRTSTLRQPRHQPSHAIRRRPNTQRLHMARGTLNLNPDSHTDTLTISGELHRIRARTIRRRTLGRDSQAQPPREVDHPTKRVRIPSATPLTHEPRKRHLRQLVLNDLHLQPQTKRRIRLSSRLQQPIPVRWVRHTLRRPLMPRQPLVLALNTRSAHPLKRRTIRVRRRRRPRHDDLRITRRRSRSRRQQRLKLLIRQFLRLIKHEVIDREATTRPTGPSHKLNRTTVRQNNGFLTVRLPNILHKRSQLRILPLVLKERLKPQKRLPRRLHLMRRVQNLPAQHHNLEQLDNLKDAVLAILTRHRQPTPAGSQLPISLTPQPRRNNQRLPRIRRQPIRRRQKTRVITISPLLRPARLQPYARLLLPEQHDVR